MLKIQGKYDVFHLRATERTRKTVLVRHETHYVSFAHLLASTLM